MVAHDLLCKMKPTATRYQCVCIPGPVPSHVATSFYALVLSGLLAVRHCRQVHSRREGLLLGLISVLGHCVHAASMPRPGRPGAEPPSKCCDAVDVAVHALSMCLRKPTHQLRDSCCWCSSLLHSSVHLSHQPQSTHCAHICLESVRSRF